MKVLEYLSTCSVLIFIFIVIFFGLIEKKNIFEFFCEGAKEGGKLALNLFPTLLGLMIAINMLSNSGIFEYLNHILFPILKILNINSELVPLIMLRPISGSTTTAIATNLMKTYGVDSKIGLIASCIMGATETTIFVAILYGSSVNIKNLKEVILIGILGDLICVFFSIFAYNLGILN